MSKPEENRFQGRGKLSALRERWTPDGEMAVVAELILKRPSLWQARAVEESMQPIPLRAVGKVAEHLLAHHDKEVIVEGVLRRRCYRREGRPHWGQVEVWVQQIHPCNHNNMEEHST